MFQHCILSKRKLQYIIVFFENTALYNSFKNQYKSLTKKQSCLFACAFVLAFPLDCKLMKRAVRKF